MALPNVSIKFANGAIGTVTPSAECVVGLMVSATAVTDKFVLGTAYTIYSLAGAEEIGLDETNNAFAYGQIKKFYAEAGTGAELWVYGVAKTVKPSVMLDKTGNYGMDFIKQANGRLRVIVAAWDNTSATYTLKNGLDEDVMTAVKNGNELAEEATSTLYAPCMVVVYGYGFATGASTSVDDLKTMAYNRVAVLIGTTDSGVALGTLAGRIAACPVERSIARVKDGPLNVETAEIGTKDASASSENETLNTKGYITFRTFVGKSGYYFTTDHMATAEKDDYHTICNRRVIDKAYRIAYETLLEFLNQELAVTDSGTIAVSMTHAIQSAVESAIQNEMTAYGNLGNDPEDDSDNGVECYIDPKQNILKTSTVEVSLKVKPYGYANYIDVTLGFLVNE